MSVFGTHLGTHPYFLSGTGTQGESGRGCKDCQDGKEGGALSRLGISKQGLAVLTTPFGHVVMGIWAFVRPALC